MRDVRDHGGRMHEAARRWNIPRGDWLDLSAGLNPDAYPVPPVPQSAWHRLPDENDALYDAARAYYGTMSLLAVAGTQAALQALPRLRARSRVVLQAPTYNEHAHAWLRAGHHVEEACREDLASHIGRADVLVIVNPNNPTGDRYAAAQLLEWHALLARRGGWLVLDEAFIDAEGESLAGAAASAGLIVLRSLGKFFGLAGARLGFACAAPGLLQKLAEELGPWHVGGPGQFAAQAALQDEPWQRRARTQLRAAGERLAGMLREFGMPTTGTPLFRFWRGADAPALHDALAREAILTRLFAHCDPPGVRFGLPGAEAQWRRLRQALEKIRGAA